jgi:hypothetical protein
VPESDVVAPSNTPPDFTRQVRVGDGSVREALLRGAFKIFDIDAEMMQPRVVEAMTDLVLLEIQHRNVDGAIGQHHPLIFVHFGHYDEPEILRYESPSVCSIGADVGHPHRPELPEFTLVPKGPHMATP